MPVNPFIAKQIIMHIFTNLKNIKHDSKYLLYKISHYLVYKFEDY